MENILNWEWKANTVLQIVFFYTLGVVRHKISFYYAFNADHRIDPVILSKNLQDEMIINGFSQ